jgi:AcrR family transcriptional regulator
VPLPFSVVALPFRLHKECQPEGNPLEGKEEAPVQSVAGLPYPDMALDLDSTATSRSRLLAAGKELFAKHGYEQASTAAIARLAGTSESQLARYFDGKAGLLEAIFNESWRPLTEEIQFSIASCPSAREAVSIVLSAVTKALGHDPELAFLFLFEGRRVRGADEKVSSSKGFVQFSELVRSLIKRGLADGSFSPNFSESAIASALMGAAEAMIRDRTLAEREGKRALFSERETRAVFQALLSGLSPQRSPLPIE